MWREQAAEERIGVAVDGYKVIAYAFGKGDETAICLNGGLGLACDYLRQAHSCLVDDGYRVVAFDQLGCGAADRPSDPKLWGMKHALPDAEINVFPGSSHMPFYEEPQLCYPALKDFLKRNLRR